MVHRQKTVQYPQQRAVVKASSRKDENHSLPQGEQNLCRVLQRQLDGDTFQWSDWIDTDATTLKWREAINELYRKRVTNGRTGETTWQVNYMGRLRQIPMSEAVTPNTIRKALEKYRREQCSYAVLWAVIAKVFPDPKTSYASHDVPSDADLNGCRRCCSPLDSVTYGLRGYITRPD